MTVVPPGAQLQTDHRDRFSFAQKTAQNPRRTSFKRALCFLRQVPDSVMPPKLSNGYHPNNEGIRIDTFTSDWCPIEVDTRVFGIFACRSVLWGKCLINAFMNKVWATFYRNLSRCIHERGLDSGAITAFNFRISISGTRRPFHFICVNSDADKMKTLFRIIPLQTLLFNVSKSPFILDYWYIMVLYVHYCLQRVNKKDAFITMTS